MNPRFLFFILIILLQASFYSGCGKKAAPKKSIPATKTNAFDIKPYQAMRTEVEALEMQDIERKAQAYAEQLVAARERLQSFRGKLNNKENPPSEAALLALKQNVLKEQQQVVDLVKKYTIYSSVYIEKGGSPAKIQIKPKETPEEEREKEEDKEMIHTNDI